MNLRSLLKTTALALMCIVAIPFQVPFIIVGVCVCVQLAITGFWNGRRLPGHTAEWLAGDKGATKPWIEVL